jgi:TetR/AcrR family transcriptional repressor of lmrAB and yxaGH operons
MILEMLTDLAARHRQPATFVQAWCKVMAGWMEESDFRSGCPIATTVLETAPASPGITQAGRRAVLAWTDVVAGVLAKGGLEAREARRKAGLLVAAMEGALILSRVHQSTRPILDVARLV